MALHDLKHLLDSFACFSKVFRGRVEDAGLGPSMGDNNQENQVFSNEIGE